DSLGVMVYEWLTGNRPFSGTFAELAVKHITTPPPPLHETLPDIPPEVEQVVLTALAKDPKQRFSSVQAFAMALERAAKVAQAVADQETKLSLHTPQQPVVLASLVPPTPPIADSVRHPASLPAFRPAELASALNAPDTSRGRKLSPGKEAQAAAPT